MNNEFDDIRPYYDEEIPAAMQRITESRYFPLLSEYVFPGVDMAFVKDKLHEIDTVLDFQKFAMIPANEQIVRRSITELSFSGLENLKDGKSHLLIANHRDIMMDASLVNYLFLINGLDTSEITFGANLMSDPTVVDVGKSNKMFKVVRGGNLREFYAASRHLSDYIRKTITQRGQSVWIAQRNGRTKDGNDLTDQGIISMFVSSGGNDKLEAFAALNPVPVTISYEWEPCDTLKVLERYKSRLGPYIKQAGEDLNSVLVGILSPKGRVHINFSKPLTADDIATAVKEGSGHFSRDVAAYIDKCIYRGYKLFPSNYIAHDLLYGKDSFKDYYSESEFEEFKRKKERLLEIKDCDTESLEAMYLQIYAKNIDNYNAVVQDGISR